MTNNHVFNALFSNSIKEYLLCIEHYLYFSLQLIKSSTSELVSNKYERCILKLVIWYLSCDPMYLPILKGIYLSSFVERPINPSACTMWESRFIYSPPMECKHPFYCWGLDRIKCIRKLIPFRRGTYCNHYLTLASHTQTHTNFILLFAPFFHLAIHPFE